MKIQRITLENFGIYKQKHFEFDDHPFVLIFGPNEAGKTTTLNGLRQAIFGFRARNPYLTGAPMSAEVVATLLDGRTLEFVRRKGRPDSIMGTLDSRQLADDDVSQLLGDLDLETYEHLFGFSQEELRRGQDALKSVRLTEALAGGSLAGMHAFDRLRVELGDSLAKLYKARGSTSLINLKLAEISRAKEELRQREVLPAVIEDWRNKLEARQREAERLRDEHETQQREYLIVERQLQALPHFRERRAALAQLRDIDLPAQVDAAFAAHWKELTDKRQDLMTRFQTEQQTLESERGELNGLTGDGDLLEYEDQIESVGYQSEEIPRLNSDRDSCQTQCDEARERLQRLMENLQISELSKELLQYTISEPLRHQLLQLGKEYSATQQQVLNLKAKLDAAQESLQVMKQPHQRMPVPDNLAELSQRVNQLEQLESQVQDQTRLLQAQMAAPGFSKLAARLSIPLEADCDLDSEWNVPQEQQLLKFAEQFAHLDRSREKLQSLKDQHLADLQGLRSEESVKQPASQAVRGEEILASSAELKQRHQTIVRQWLDELSQPLIAASISLSQQKERLDQLFQIVETEDQLQHELIQIADAVAAKNHHERQLNQLQSRVEECDNQLKNIDQERFALSRQWADLWRDIPIAPLDPPSMLDWSSDFQKWRSEQSAQRDSRRHLHTTHGLVRNVRNQLLDLWPNNLRLDVDARVLREQIQEWQAYQNQQAQEYERQRSTVEKVESLAQRLQELSASQCQRLETYAQWLQECPVQCDWPLEQVGLLLDSLEQVRREQRSIDRWQQQISDTSRRIAEFSQSVDALAQSIVGSSDLRSSHEELESTPAHSMMRGSPERLAARWLHSLRELRAQKSKRIRVTSQIAQREQRCQEMTQELSQVHCRLAELTGTAGATNAAEVSRMLEQVVIAEQLDKKISELTASLAAYCPHNDLSEFCTLLETVDEAALRIERQDGLLQLERIESSRQTLHQEIGSLKERIDQLANSEQAQQNLQQIQNFRGELAELAEQWILERLAQELLSRSMELFSSENEPKLLSLTREYLAHLTGGRYTNVEHDKVDKNQFVIRNQHGEAFSPDRLSTGTREQLYLAIRMAFITNHCEHHEPLPVIMDDCFVNFDDRRTRLAIEAISKWDPSVQTIILSCHSRVPRLLADIAPYCPVILLEQNQVMPAAEAAEYVSTLYGSDSGLSAIQGGSLEP